MPTTTPKTALLAAVAISTLAAASLRAADNAGDADVQKEIQSLKARIAELEKKENENWLTAERASQIKQIVNEAIADAKTRGQFLDGNLQAGYKNGFYIQDGDQFKLVIGGYAQVRYVYAQHEVHNRDRYTGSNDPVASDDPANANGFELRRARVNFSGTLFKNVFFKLEGDFAGSSSNSGNFQVTDAYVGYNFTNLFKVKAGAFKVPFTKVELQPDPGLEFMERPEVNLPFDAQRAIGASLFGDIIADTLNYEVNVNNGSKSNTLGRIDDTAGAFDNRLGYYGRLQWAGSGKISDFADEPDLRTKERPFVWMLGGAAGYESQNATINAYPHAQTSANMPGLSTADAPGYLSTANLNGDMYRGTVDWSAKWEGWSFNTAAYIQQINQNEGAFASGSSAVLPYGATDSSFFQTGYYGQIGYMLIPSRLELVGRAGQLLTEGYPNRGEFYSIGANYYIFGHGAKIQTDVTYIPNETAYTDAASDLLRNTQELIYRVQFQVRF